LTEKHLHAAPSLRNGQMTLVDRSLWIDYFRRGNARLNIAQHSTEHRPSEKLDVEGE